jgi:acid phosphatase
MNASRMSRRLTLSAVFLILPLSLHGQVSPRLIASQNQPANLGKLKLSLIAYHDCKPHAGCYETDINRQSDLAIAYLERRVKNAKPGEKLALVLDIDETALSNWDEEKQDDFGYIPQDWNAWVKKKSAPAIAGTLRLYDEAVKDGVSIFFITGRSSDQAADTSETLIRAGYRKWTGLALRAKDHPQTQTVTDYKSGERKKIVAAGYSIILNVGDQRSDLNGTPQADLSVELPNPFYYIP